MDHLMKRRRRGDVVAFSGKLWSVIWLHKAMDAYIGGLEMNRETRRQVLMDVYWLHKLFAIRAKVTKAEGFETPKRGQTAFLCTTSWTVYCPARHINFTAPTSRARAFTGAGIGTAPSALCLSTPFCYGACVCS